MSYQEIKKLTPKISVVRLKKRSLKNERGIGKEFIS